MNTAPSYAGMVMLVSQTPTGRRSIRYLDQSALHATIRLLTRKGYTGFRVPLHLVDAKINEERV